MGVSLVPKRTMGDRDKWACKTVNEGSRAQTLVTLKRNSTAIV